MKKNTYQIFAAGLLLFISCSAYTFLSIVPTEAKGAAQQLDNEEQMKKEIMIQLPDVSIVQKAVEIGEKLLNVY